MIARSAVLADLEALPIVEDYDFNSPDEQISPTQLIESFHSSTLNY